MTAAAQARGLRRARKLRALRIVNSGAAATGATAGPRTAHELRELWLAWGGLDPIVRIPEPRRPSPDSVRR